jgi:outer membrane lipoprotein-sorting protein
MENHANFHHEELLNHAVDAVLREPEPDALSPDQIAQLVAKVRQAADKPCPITFMERIRKMKPRTKLAVAAAALLISFGLLSWLVPGGGVAVAFADVAEALNNVHSATWKSTAVVELKGPQKKTVTYHTAAMFLAPSRERTEITAEGDTSVSICDGQKDRVLILSPSVKTAMFIDFKNLPPDNPFGKTLQGLRELVANAQDGKAGKVERLGEQTIDGRRAQGYRIQVGAVDVKIWADPKTLLPVRVEQSSGSGTGAEVRIVMTDFQVGVDLDESLFSFDVPAGYTIQKIAAPQIDASRSPWAYLADVLKMAAEYNDGVFPPALRGEQGIDGLVQRVAQALREKHSTASREEVMKVVTDFSMKLGGAFGVLNALPPDAFHYAGKDVKLGTPDRPILWIKQKKGGRCIVLYADLSVKEVSADETPKVPESEASPKPR